MTYDFQCCLLQKICPKCKENVPQYQQGKSKLESNVRRHLVSCLKFQYVLRIYFFIFRGLTRDDT